MTWTRLSDDFADRPDLLAASRSARLLHVEAMVYGNRQGNDGTFRRALVARMTDADDWDHLVDELIDAGIWTDLGDGRLRIDWPAWEQEPADVVRQRKEANAKRAKDFRERGKRHNDGDHSICTDACPFKRAASRNEPHNALRDGTPSRPLPSRPEGEGEGDGTSARGGSAGATPHPGATPWESGITPTITVQK